LRQPERTLQVCQTNANNNNEIGLPKTLLAATPQDQAIVLEMGMRGRGEIELLSRIARPDLALITNIGVSHIERLGSQEAIFQAKAEIIAGLASGARVILNADDP
jgi:UDP-N-acetylmuramoyl-tripeptide--D-alanyl-D-alanine ligase